MNGRVTLVTQYWIQQDSRILEFFRSVIREAEKRFRFTCPSGSVGTTDAYRMHGTILGLEAKRCNDQWYSDGLIRNDPTGFQNRSIDFKKVVTFLKDKDPDIRIRFGGFDPKKPVGFQQKDPSERSFYWNQEIHNPEVNISGCPMAMSAGVLQPSEFTLVAYREEFARELNIEGKWNNQSSKQKSEPRDLYVKVGMIEPEPAADLDIKAMEMRDWLFKLPPIEISISRENMAVVAYGSTCLDPKSSMSVPVMKLTHELLKYMYEAEW